MRLLSVFLPIGLLSLLSFTTMGCAADADPELAPVEETQDELQAASRLVGDYENGRGKFSSLSLAQVTENGRTQNRFTAEQIVMCVRAPCPTIKWKGKWFARGESLTLYPEGRERVTFKTKLADGKLSLTDARGLEIAELEKITPAPAELAAILARHGVPKMKVEIDATERDAQERASGVRVKFKDAFDKAVDLFVNDEDGLKHVVEGMEDNVREQCQGQSNLVLCLANDSQTTVRLMKRSESAPQGDRPEDVWVFELFVGTFTDHGYYAVIDKARAGQASIYSFN